MTRKELAALAFEECCSENTTAHHGGKDRPFWNLVSTQFMYAPAFRFPTIPGCNHYRFVATDETGASYAFNADNPCALLTPIWRELSEGIVTLNVYSCDAEGKNQYLVGSRTFFRLATFPEETPKAVCSYRESAAKAFDYAMSQGFVNYWLDHDAPDPDYDLNIYPCKMVSSLIYAMIAYAKSSPERAADAMKIATKAADYVLSITPGAGAAMEGVPPTYHFGFCDDPVKHNILTANWQAGQRHKDTVMMIYPASMGSAFLALEKATGDHKYGDAALKIGAFYREHVQPNGTWYLVYTIATAEPFGPNYLSPLDSVVPFMMKLYEKTGDASWKNLADNAAEYVTGTLLKTYNWEGQFEDVNPSLHYNNLTHFACGAVIRYYAQYRADDPQCMAEAEDLMRYVEDQFVIWKRPAPWNLSHYDTSIWTTPCGLEQYQWYVPIDGSTACIADDFLALYKATGKELYLAKAHVLVDQITRVQHENGQIPTHWMHTQDAEDNFWMNCMFGAAETLVEFAEFDAENK